MTFTWFGFLLGFIAGGLFWAAVLLFFMVLEKIEQQVQSSCWSVWPWNSS